MAAGRSQRPAPGASKLAVTCPEQKIGGLAVHAADQHHMHMMPDIATVRPGILSAFWVDTTASLPMILIPAYGLSFNKACPEEGSDLLA